MDPVSIVSVAVAVAGLGEKFVQVLRAGYKKLVQGRRRGAHPSAPNTSRKAQLQSDLSWLCDLLLYLGSPQSQVQKTLLEQLLASAQHSQKFLERPNEQLYPQDIEDCRELFLSKFQQQVQRAIHQLMKEDDIQSKIHTQATNIVKGIMDRMPADQRDMKNVIVIIISKESHANPGLVEAMSFVQEMPSVLEYKGNQAGTSTNLVEYACSSNPNCKMSVVALEGEGDVEVCSYQGNQWKVSHQGLNKVVRILTAEKPMKVCAERGFFYYEVKLVEMEELYQNSIGTRRGGVGVGFAHEVRCDKVAGWYRKSYGYDGRVPSAYNAYCEGNVCDFQIGPLLRGDTLGIGLLTQPGGAPIVFFTKNGDLQGCISNSRLARYASDLYPVISLASMRVEVMVNFYGPFHLPCISDIVAAGKIASR